MQGPCEASQSGGKGSQGLLSLPEVRRKTGSTAGAGGRRLLPGVSGWRGAGESVSGIVPWATATGRIIQRWQRAQT